jgi:hypothetical protein
MTLIVNLFGGPGVGKSTLAAGTFFCLKQQKISCELVTEYAKTLTWENRHSTLECQPYVFGKQLYSLEVLIDKVDVIITDSPICLSLFYKADRYPPSFSQSVIDIFNSFQNTNYYIERCNDDYDSSGRLSSINMARKIDEKILTFLEEFYISYENIARKFESAEYIANQVMSRL